VPTQTLFAGHCERVASRYGLSPGGGAACSLRKARVVDIEYSGFPALEPDAKLFSVRTDDGTVRHARTVVLAVGAANAPCIPPPILARLDPAAASSHSRGEARMCHAMQITTFPDPVVRSKIRNHQDTNILIVGGGLTAAQLALLAIKRGVSRVWMVTRGPSWRVKPFDVDLEWMGKFRNLPHAAFWQLDSDEERLQRIRDARGGGSVTPDYMKSLLEQVRTGRLYMQSGTRMDTDHAKLDYDPCTQTWAVAADPPLPGGEDGNVPRMDYICFATGVETNCEALGYLRTMHSRYPIRCHGGLPCLNHDLMWNDDVPLFVTGKLAGLRLGPGAGNLGGARAGERSLAAA
jgi:hypothetical protein